MAITNSNQLDPKVVLITGATSGIGKETALLLAAKGIWYMAQLAISTIKTCLFRLLPMDVRNETSIKEAVQQILSEAGRIDILINNAGVGITGAVEELPAEQLHKRFCYQPLRRNCSHTAGTTYNANAKKRAHYQHCLYCGLYGLTF